MKYSSAFFIIGFVLASCSAFSESELNRSVMKKYYDPPTIKLSPDPSIPINSSSADVSIDVEHVGGLGSIVYQSEHGTKTYSASSAKSYTVNDTFSSAVSRTFPVKVTAYSSVTGITSTTNVEYLLFTGAGGSPPLITVSEPVLDRLLSPGNVSIRGSAHHPSEKIGGLSTKFGSSADVKHPVPTPNPPKYDFTQVETAVLGKPFTITITATSGTGAIETTNITWQVVDVPIIDSISPPIAGTVIDTVITNFSVVVRSPHSATSVKLYWDGTLKDTLTTDGLGTPLVFKDISIPLRSSAAPVGNATLRIEASYPSGGTAVRDYVYRVDHTSALGPPIITSLSPDPGVPLRKSPFLISAEFNQASLGLKSVSLSRISAPASSWTTNFSAFPLVTTYSHIENIPISSYAGANEYRFTVVSRADITITSNITYILAGPTNTITLSSNAASYQAFNFQVTSDIDISYAVISTNLGSGTWHNIAAYAPGSPSFNTHFLISLPYNRDMGVRLTSVNANGVISTNALVSTFVTHSSAFIATNHPKNTSTVPQTGGFPFTATVHSPSPITQVELQTNGRTLFSQTGITAGSTSYTFDREIPALRIGPNEIKVLVNGVEVVGSPIEYNATPLSSLFILASFPQDQTVVTSDTIRINFKNWSGSSRLPGSQSTIEKVSTGEVKSISTTVNPGASYEQPATDAFSLDIGENRFKIRLRNGIISENYEITIYRHNGVDY